ncbi:hypothetical protein D3C87_1901390 [compost metagenome]
MGASLLAIGATGFFVKTALMPSPAGWLPQFFGCRSYFELVSQFMRRAQRPGIAEQEQVAHHFLEHHRLAGIQAIEVKITLILQLTQRFFFK